MQGAFPWLLQPKAGRSRAPPGVRDERAVAAELPTGMARCAGGSPSGAVHKEARIRRCRPTPEVFTGTQGASRTRTATVGSGYGAHPPRAGPNPGRPDTEPGGARHDATAASPGRAGTEEPNRSHGHRSPGGDASSPTESGPRSTGNRRGTSPSPTPSARIPQPSPRSTATASGSSGRGTCVYDGDTTSRVTSRGGRPTLPHADAAARAYGGPFRSASCRPARRRGGPAVESGSRRAPRERHRPSYRPPCPRSARAQDGAADGAGDVSERRAPITEQRPPPTRARTAPGWR